VYCNWPMTGNIRKTGRNCGGQKLRPQHPAIIRSCRAFFADLSRPEGGGIRPRRCHAEGHEVGQARTGRNITAGPEKFCALQCPPSPTRGPLNRSHSRPDRQPRIPLTRFRIGMPLDFIGGGEILGGSARGFSRLPTLSQPRRAIELERLERTLVSDPTFNSRLCDGGSF
jgi:hypothetical protein